MSQQQWEAPSRPGTGGSVRRARERMEAGLPPEIPQLPPQQRPYESPRSVVNQPSQIPRLRPQMPPGVTATRNGQGPIGVAISRPTQVPQWPLAGTIENVQDQNTNQQYQPPAGRSNPPQRPPRPSRVPSILDASRLQEHTPTFQYKPQQEQSQARGQTRYQDDDEDYVTSPMTQSSRPSTISSVGTIPDFPVPMPSSATAPRRSANLGPPPTSRRGASSYYSQASYVSPIPEESPRSQLTHESYASSAAMPSSWGSESPGYDYDDKYDERDRGFGHDIIEEGRESRESNDNDDAGLIRSASLGKRAKPSMIMTKGSERIEQRPGAVPLQRSKLGPMGVMAAVSSAAVVNSARENKNERDQWPMIGSVESPSSGDNGFIDKSSSSSETEVPTLAKGMTMDDRTPVPMPSANILDTKSRDLLGPSIVAGSLLPGSITPTRTPSPGFNRLSAIRRPPRLDMDAVRDAEARGSLTSLPDLIRRATRLAAMMDRGKRPGSRMALNDFPSESELSREKDLDLSSEEKHQSGLSGMLAAFPPPGLATPREGTPRPNSAWPSPYAENRSTAGLADSQPQKKRRRCCGLPCWGFFLVLLILSIIIAAAVVVPLELLVIHKSKSTSKTQLSPLQQCQQDVTTACQNGGSTFLSSGNCACLCINGFTGSTCTVASSTGCTTTTLSNEYPNVTLGDSIPRLISAAQANFSIPLFSTIILARFNSASLSCLSENALVTFDGLSQRVGDANARVVPSGTTEDLSASVTTPAQRKRDDDSISSFAMPTTTPQGIVIDTATSPVISSLPTSSSSSEYRSPYSSSPSSESSPESSSATATSTPTGTSSALPTAAFIITEQVLDFARVAVLFILQQEDLDSASSAQTSLQHFFSASTSTNSGAANISLGNANTANLMDFQINLGNGTVGSYNQSLSRRSTEMGGRAINHGILDYKQS